MFQRSPGISLAVSEIFARFNSFFWAGLNAFEAQINSILDSPFCLLWFDALRTLFVKSPLFITFEFIFFIAFLREGTI